MGLYDKDILVNYDESEIDRMDMWIDHERDYNFIHMQVLDKLWISI